MATPPTTDSVGNFQDLLLRVTPPRVPRHLVSRARLLSSAPALRDYAAFVVQAPAGFGKTSLLAQWRREYLAYGVVVAWLSAQAGDTPRRLAQGLALAVRVAAGRPGFCHGLLEAGAVGGLENITVFLAELTQTALNVVLILDEADRLHPASREALAYLLRNAPANLRVIVAARTDCQLGIDDLVDYGKCALVGAEALRFRFDETLELVRERCGTETDSHTAAKLHELTEGWPLGLQLALTVMAGASNPAAELSILAAEEGRLREHLVSRLLANLAPADLDFLTQVAILDPLHPSLCQAVAATSDAPARLERMSRETPLFSASEQGDWLRMHALARDALRQRFAALPAEKQKALHARAAQWLADHGRVEAAAWHALAAGLHEQASDLAEQSLYGFVTTTMTQGRLGVMTEWLALLPPDALDRRPRLLLAAAWALALSQRDTEAEQLVDRILSQPGVDDALRCECALILSGAALFADDPDRAVAQLAPWVQNPPLRDPLLRQIHANRSAFCTLLTGDAALARLRQQQASRHSTNRLPSYLELWGEFHIAMTHVWEIQMQPAERLLRSILGRAESELGRRNPFACQVAALLAAVLWERNAPAESVALLANRLDVLEQTALPICLMLAYRTLASIEVSQGTEARALELLEAQHAAGSARNLERICILSLCDQVRLHAKRFRAQTCQELCTRIDAELAQASARHGPLWQRMVAAPRELAQVYAAVAEQDWDLALDRLVRTDEAARVLRMGRLHIEVLALKALALSRSGGQSEAMLREVLDLAASHGLLRAVSDVHPELHDLVHALAQPSGGGGLDTPPPVPPSAAVPALPPTERPAPAPRALGSTALTPKEREVLDLLARNLSNKEIGLAMQVGEETIKWHMKNLFFKLSAGSRKQVVLRARVLGLLPTLA